MVRPEERRKKLADPGAAPTFPFANVVVNPNSLSEYVSIPPAPFEHPVLVP